MKQIFQGLIAMQLQTDYKEIYEFRATHTSMEILSSLCIFTMKMINFATPFQ